MNECPREAVKRLALGSPNLSMALTAASFHVQEAKTGPSRLVERALSGEEVIIARAGVPVVRLVAVVARTSRNAS